MNDSDDVVLSKGPHERGAATEGPNALPHLPELLAVPDDRDPRSLPGVEEWARDPGQMPLLTAFNRWSEDDFGLVFMNAFEAFWAGVLSTLNTMDVWQRRAGDDQ